MEIMMLMNRNEVEWDRKTETDTDEFGDPIKSSVSGFPQNVRGHFSHRGSLGSQGTGGLGNSIDAVFYSPFWSSGQNGDLVTFNSVSYVVDSVSTKDKVNGSKDYTKYGLKKVALGEDPNGV